MSALLSRHICLSFLQSVRQCLDSTDESCVVAAIGSLGDFASISPSSLQLVLDDRALADAWLALLSRKVELQGATLKSIATVVSSAALRGGAGPALTRELLSRASSVRGDLLAFALQAAMRPFPEMKEAAYALLAAVAAQTWGVVPLLALPRFASFIVDTEVEMTREGKLWKFEVVRALADNPTLKNGPDDVVAAIVSAANKGPFHVFAKLVGPITMNR